MKKIYFVIFGGGIISILIGFWVYSFLYGSPENTNTFFTDLGLFGQNNSEEIVTPPVPTAEETPVVDVMNDPLRQLTTKPVIGMRVLEKATTIMRYVEAGTGHVYDIDLASGQESRVSPISVPVASEAAISPSGDYIAIRSGYNNQNDLVIINIEDSANPKSTIIPNQVESFAFGFNNELLFTEFTLGQTEGKGYLPSTGVTRRLFLAPFTAHNMAWSNSSTSNHIIYTKPSTDMLGYAYEITAGGLRRLSQSGYALSVFQSAGIRFIGTRIGTAYVTTIVNRQGEEVRSPGVTIPDKCIAGFLRADRYYCAGPIELRSPQFPDTWYRGTEAFDDYIWENRSGGSTLLVYPLQKVGRSLDIMSMNLSPNERMLYFINKTDKSLWVYEI